MKVLKKNYYIYFLLLLFTLSLGNCASKKQHNTDKKATNKTEKITDKNILYIVDGKEISSKDINKIDTKDIQSITVYKDKKEIKKFTDKDYDGVIIITMKKL